MHVVFLAGGIGSGKSSVAELLAEAGAVRIDLDALSREVLQPGSPVLEDIAEAFGRDLLDPATGVLDRAELARRAFSTDEETRRLEQLEIPGIMRLLDERLARLAQEAPDALCVVEVPLLDRLQGQTLPADEVVVVSCPAAVRRCRAIARGMDARDVDARIARQPSDAWLADHADSLIDNSGTEEELAHAVAAWLRQRQGGGADG
jgi:dephospho-CoA kinase